VTRVALNACLSSSAQHESLPSMAATLIEKGVTSVSAMSYRMLDQTATIYYDAFYQALILGGKDFHEAAAKGREALRLKSQDPKEWLNPTNYRNRVYTFNNKFQPPLALVFINIFFNLSRCLSMAKYGVSCHQSGHRHPLYAPLDNQPL
jgi:hypothetical protein